MDRVLKGVFLCALFLFLVSSAFAGPIVEPSISAILDNLYGLGNVVEISSANDQVFSNAHGSRVFAEARFAAFEQHLGYFADSDPFQYLLNVGGWGYCGGISSADIPASTLLRFGLDPNGPGSGPGIWSSEVSQNYDLFNHMRTWQIIGSGDGYDNNPIGDYVIAWEDLPYGGDSDYNDSVYRVHFNSPEPATMSLIGVGLFGLLGLRKKIL